MSKRRRYYLKLGACIWCDAETLSLGLYELRQRKVNQFREVVVENKRGGRDRADAVSDVDVCGCRRGQGSYNSGDRPTVAERCRIKVPQLRTRADRFIGKLAGRFSPSAGAARRGPDGHALTGAAAKVRGEGSVVTFESARTVSLRGCLRRAERRL